MRYFIWRALSPLLNVLKITVCSYRKIFLPIIQKPSVQTLAILNATAAVTVPKKEDEVDKNETDESELFFSKDVRAACLKNDDALKDLMNVLSACLIEISKEYQENVGKQIDLIRQCTKLGPVGEHWDILTKYRVEATELREELTKYETLVQKVGQMAYNQAVTSLLSGIEDAMDLVEVHYSNLEKTVTELARENYQWETKLLFANRDSIIHGLK